MGEPASPPVALVTGGTRGIGRAVVEALLSDGWRVFFCGRGEESVRTARRELAERFANRVSGRSADVRSQEEVDALVGWVEAEAGRLDCLVNNAGVGVFAPVDRISGADWRRVIETNLSGAFYAIRAAAPLLERDGGGWIFNIASLAACNPFAGGAAYNASKFGMLGLSEAAMLDLRKRGVRVSTILPGSVDTGFGGGERGREWKLAPDEIARAVLDLLRYPHRALPSRIDLRPSRPPTG